MEHVRIGELPETTRPQVLLDLMQEIDHRQHDEQRAIADLFVTWA
jgi:hypothetical protein